MSDIILHVLFFSPSLYLGLPLGDNLKAVLLGSHSIRKRLAGWKKRFFSEAGRLALISFVMSGISVSNMSLFRIPSLVCKRMEKYMRDIL